MDFLFVVNKDNRKLSRRNVEAVAPVCSVETAPVYADNLERNAVAVPLEQVSTAHLQNTLAAIKRIRTNCKCMKGFWLCPACIGMHIAQVAEASVSEQRNSVYEKN
jgi:hypothetical protein